MQCTIREHVGKRRFVAYNLGGGAEKAEVG
jgi:hypothetical protein